MTSPVDAGSATSSTGHLTSAFGKRAPLPHRSGSDLSTIQSSATRRSKIPRHLKVLPRPQWWGDVIEYLPNARTVLELVVGFASACGVQLWEFFGRKMQNIPSPVAVTKSYPCTKSNSRSLHLERPRSSTSPNTGR
ncbi:hypothetical protein JCM33374_g3518 [Metschnikowia sp. JCM 33374]|nr:hypothetical protein JCM33374_g3518 [Metschnikowia sp. JCM 33374]